MDRPAYIPPREWELIRAKNLELDRLADIIDRKYARSDFKGIDDLEIRAERLEEELSALFHHYLDDDEPAFAYASTEELILATFRAPHSFSDRRGWLDNMKETLRLAVRPYDPDLAISDEQILQIAQDLDRQRRELIRRYKTPKRK